MRHKKRYVVRAQAISEGHTFPREICFEVLSFRRQGVYKAMLRKLDRRNLFVKGVDIFEYKKCPRDLQIIAMRQEHVWKVVPPKKANSPRRPRKPLGQRLFHVFVGGGGLESLKA